MTISSTNCKAIYVTSPEVADYAYNFKIFHAAQLKVTVVDALTKAETCLALATDYGVSGVGSVSGGVVRLTASGLAKAGSGHKLVIMRGMEFTQETDYRPHDVFPAEIHEAALDTLTMMCQELREMLGRAVLRTPDEDKIIPYHDLIALLQNVEGDKAAAEAAAALSSVKADEAKAAATEAKTARTQAQTARTGAEAAAELAGQKADSILSLTVSAVDLPIGDAPTADYDPATGKMKFGIPAGPQGPTGPQGDIGPQGATGAQGPKGERGEQGEAGTGINILGKLDNDSQLPVAGNIGDGYLISGEFYVWSAITGAWQNVGTIKGPQGDKGDAGPQGATGAQGPKGDTGATGPQGAAGSDATVTAATATVAGKVMLATADEVTAGTNATKAVTPAAVKPALDAHKEVIDGKVKAHDESPEAHTKLFAGIKASSSPVGDIRFFPFRASALPPGWYFANGDRYLTSSQQGQALLSLGSPYWADWGVATIAPNHDTINVPNLFYGDGRGLFVRTVNGKTRQVGTVEADAFQGHAHTARYINNSAGSGTGSYSDFIRPANNTTGKTLTIASDDTNGTPRIAAETRPLNIGMTPAVYLGV